MLERADRPGFWQSVTGSLDFRDEPLETAAAREVGEETGIDIHALPSGALQNLHHAVQYEIYPSWRHRYPPGVTQNTEHWFALEVPLDIQIQLAPREHLQYVWLPYQEAALKCFSHTNRDAIMHFYQQP